MTTYAGKPISYNPSKEVVNKEPRTTSFVIEKQYRIHRQHLLEILPAVDDRLAQPMLMNQAWKKLQTKIREDKIMNSNEEIYRRLAKVENRESVIMSDAKVHIKRVVQQIRYMKNVKEYGRQRKINQIQRENEALQRRIEGTKPQYTVKECNEWYKNHSTFKQGR